MNEEKEQSTQLPADLRAALERIVEYLWLDEERNADCDLGGLPEGHILNSLLVVRRYLEGVPHIGSLRQADVRGEGWSL